MMKHQTIAHAVAALSLGLTALAAAYVWESPSIVQLESTALGGDGGAVVRVDTIALSAHSPGLRQRLITLPIGIAALGFLGALHAYGRSVRLAVALALLAFSVAGAFSVGLFYLPGAAAMTFSALLTNGPGRAA